MEEADFAKVKGLYARLLAIRRSLSNSETTPGPVSNDAIEIARALTTLTGEDFYASMFDHVSAFGSGYYPNNIRVSVYTDALRSKIEQLITYLEIALPLAEPVVQTGSLISAISDQVLRDTCLDLLSARGNFYRVINQATQVLEDRIRTRSLIVEKLEGVGLVNRVFRTDVNDTVLKAADDAGEHEGICHILRGMVLAFRNPTHHQISERFSREEALKICGMVDVLLHIVDNSTLR